MVKIHKPDMLSIYANQQIIIQLHNSQIVAEAAKMKRPSLEIIAALQKTG
jgi:hypothetical protein